MLSLGPKCAWSGQFVAQLRKSLVVECCPKAFHHLLHRHSDSRHIGCTDSHKMLMHLIWQAWEMRSPEPHSFPWGPHSRPVHGPSWTNKTKPANTYAGLWQNREETIQQSSPAKCHGMEESGWYCCTGGWEIQEAQGRHQIGGNWLHTTLKASKDRWGFACRETEAWDREHQSQAICFRLSLTVQWVARLLEQRDIFARSQGLGHRLLGQLGQEKSKQGTVLKLADRLLESWLEVARSEAASPAAKSNASSPARVGASASLPASTAASASSPRRWSFSGSYQFAIYAASISWEKPMTIWVCGVNCPENVSQSTCLCVLLRRRKKNFRNRVHLLSWSCSIWGRIRLIQLAG